MFWKLYEGEFPHANANRSTTIVAKRWKPYEGHIQFWRELDILSTQKHGNIIGLVGYCSELEEKIIVYEHSSNGRLDKHLDNASLTGMNRLNICIDVASGLTFLHGGAANHEHSLIHRDIKSGSILLDNDWKAKLSNLELSSKTLAYENILHDSDNVYGSLDYIDPNCKYVFLLEESDIYSLGVVLMEILCGRLARVDGCDDCSQSLVLLAKSHYNEGKLDELVFEGIREEILPQLLTMYESIALQCLEKNWNDRPKARVVAEKLKIALEFQEDHDIWEPKLPRDYKK